ncbi:MAG: hypothetical protein WEB88_11210 [Gemmatimonadota bacterium]
MRTILTLLPGLCLLLSACGAADPTADFDPTAAVHDSAGIRMVTNPDVPLPRWTVDSVPALTIGTLEGLDGHDLGNPRGSVRLPDGGVAISDYTTRQLRFYDRTGKHVRSVGGRGSGPGEFASVAVIYRGRGDSLVVSDTGRRRLTILDAQGELGRTLSLDDWDGPQPLLRGLLHDSIVVFRVIHRGSGVAPIGSYREPVEVFYRSLDGGAYRSIGHFPGGLRFRIVDPDGVGGWGPAVPYNREFQAAVTDSQVWIGEAEGYGFEVYDVAGRLRSIVRLDRPGSPVGPAERDHWHERQRALDDREVWQRRVRQAAELVPFPPVMPPYSTMLADANGRIWVGEYQPPGATEPQSWRVFDADGQQLATTTMPQGVSVHQIGDDYVLGRWTGNLGVPHVGVFRIAFE